MKKQRVLVLMHEDLVPPEDVSKFDPNKIPPWKTEYDILWALEELGHDHLSVGVNDDLGVIRRAIEEYRPDILFNVLEEFHGATVYGQAVVSFVELMRCAYTGCNPRGLILAHDKVLTKTILTYHGINTPRFEVFRRGRKIRPPRELRYPLMVKSSFEDASLGISQKSVVHTEEKLIERIEFMHETFGTDAIVEEYVDGRELYLGILGNTRLDTFPVWEMRFNNWPDGKARIATEKVKWNYRYQVKYGIQTEPADLPEIKKREIERLGKRVYRALGLSGYARLDLRLDANGEVWLIEANGNPDLAHDEDFAKSAKATGIEYEELIQRILTLGRAWKPAWKEALEAVH
jgi:D-alanine-D-alanine ligase